MRATLLLLIVASLASTSKAGICDNGGHDLSGLQINEMPLRQTEYKPGNTKWTLNLCEKTVKSTCPSVGDAYGEENVDGICSVAFTEADQWKYGNGFALSVFKGTYRTKNDRILHVKLECDPAVGKKLAPPVRGEIPAAKLGDVLSFQLTLRTGVVCGEGSESGSKAASSVAIAFVVIMTVGPAVYLAGMVVYNYFRLGLRGKDLAPHPEFWSGVWSLFIDGIRFTIHRAKRLCGRGEGSETYAQL